MRPEITALLTGEAGMTLLTGVTLMLLPLLVRRYRRKTLYGLLIICLLGFLIPWRPVVAPRPAMTVEIPAAAVRRLNPSVRSAAPAARQTSVQSDQPLRTAETKPATRPLTPGQAALVLWACGALAVLGIEISRYLRFCRLLRRWRATPDPEAADAFDRAVRAVGLRRAPKLWSAPCVPGPLVTGLFHTAVYIPETPLPKTDLGLIFRHELTHIQQGDLPVKWLSLLVCALHWPNPAVWLLRRSLSRYCELSCDETVMAGSDLTARTGYSEALIAAIHVRAKTPTALCTAFEGGLKRMKQRILNVMDARARRAGLALVLALICLSVTTGSLLTVSAADTAGLPPFPDDYDREQEELVRLAEPVPAVAANYMPAYNNSDDPSWPAAIYAPGTPIEIIGQKWRSEYIPGVTGDGGMVWLNVNILDGEPLKDVWVPLTFVSVGEGGEAIPKAPVGVLKAPEGETHVSLFARIFDSAPFYSAESGREARLVSWQPDWVQIAVDGREGYIHAGQLTLDEAALAHFTPEWLDGYDSWRLGYWDYYQQFLAWFGEMENRYGSTDFWSNDLKVLLTDTQRQYGLLQPGDWAFVRPGPDDLTEEQVLAIGRQLINDTGAQDELGIPYYAWQVYFMYVVGENEEPHWLLRAWATHTDMDRQNIRLNRAGELIDIIPFRDDPNARTPYYEIALDLLYGEQAYLWPEAVRTAVDPEAFPPMQEGWVSEEEVRETALQAVREYLGEEKYTAVQTRFESYAMYYNYGRFSENDPEDRIFWTVRYINQNPGEHEEIQVHVNMDGTLRGEPIDDYYGDADFTPGGNG